VDTPVGRGRPPTLRRSLEEARGRSPGCRSRKRLGTRLRAPLDLKSSIITSSPPRAGILSALVLRRSAGRERGSLCYVAAARRCCFRASASRARLGPRCEEPFAAFRWHGGGANEHRRLLPKAVRQFAPPLPPLLRTRTAGGLRLTRGFRAFARYALFASVIFSRAPGISGPIRAG
jgi:hypothetical protein